MFDRFTSSRGARLTGEAFAGHHVASQQQFRDHLRDLAPELERRNALERQLASGEENFFLPGRCAVCAKATRFWVDRSYGFPSQGADTRPSPNWRERVCCEHCQLNNRMRAAIHYLLAFGGAFELDCVYVTEQVTPLFKVLKGRMPNSVGSEYLPETIPRGSTTPEGVRNETLTDLTFGSGSFRHLLTFDVLEHVPDTDRALSECARVLRPGGSIEFTVPFDLGSATTLKRASVRRNGSIEHHLAPEYHGDPLNKAGILSFYTFGWDLLRRVESHGFEKARAFIYWSQELGYYGGYQVLFTARRR
jgi:SAM-dependent methyltransferase